MKKFFTILIIILIVVGFYLIVKFPVAKIMATAKFNRFKTEYNLQEDDYEIKYFGYDLFKNDAYIYHIVYKDDPDKEYHYVFDLVRNKFDITIRSKDKYSIVHFHRYPYSEDVLFPFDEYK